MAAKKVKLGLLGCGVVGGGLVELIRKNRKLIAERSGVDLDVRRALVRDAKKKRPLEAAQVTTDAAAVLAADDVDIVVELMGGTDPAKDYVAKAIEAGKNVVTANKALLAESGGELLRLASSRNRRIGFEASVCGGIPLIRALQHGLAGNRIESLCGIVNGTCNFILTQMTEKGLAFDDALKIAGERGFAEADPSLDLDGIDAAQKILLLAELSFGAEVELSDVHVEGIRCVDAEDIERAKELGFIIKHVAFARETEGKLDLRVQPALLPSIHPLASVRNEFNAVLIKADAVGDLMFEGKGAGSLPTASSVLADIIEVAREGNGASLHLPPARDRPVVEDIESAYYLRFPIVDVPGVIGLITTALGNHDISIRHATAVLVGQDASGQPPKPGGSGSVVILVHRSSRRSVVRAVEEIARLPVLSGKPVVLRIFEENGH
ncbi:MAG: homoserine dehydrogenase [Planctomycetota bacterium]|jgi:homoserine dehydrogenase